MPLRVISLAFSTTSGCFETLDEIKDNSTALVFAIVFVTINTIVENK